MLKERLKRGDISRIAEIAGVSFSTAEKTLSQGTRNNQKVIEVAQEYLGMREAIKNKN